MAGRCAASVRPSGPSSSSDWRAFFSKPPAVRCGSVTMNGADLLPASVLKRKAVVYVRQSTPAQVQFNLESQRQQYELVEVARRRGFDAVEIIDDDLGKSASGMVARPGFERLVASLCAGHVGAVLCLDASRLARNGRDWHHLLELCGLVEARVIDREGVYDPGRPNDRLLLGMKGSISEFELGILRARMLDAARAKARRGELRISVPLGYAPDLISAVTDAVLAEIAAWQARPLEPVYPLIFFDALRVKIRDEALVRNKAVHVALGVRADGTKEILGLWIEQTEGAKFWLRVMSELKNRGVEDVLIAVVDGLKGFPEAITAVFPDAMVQTCIVHLLRHSLEFVAYKDRKAVAAALKEIYRAVDATAGEATLSAIEAGPWGRKYAAIGQSWRRAWGEVVPFYAFPAEVRRLLYTTNAIEALNSKLRRAVRARGHFPTDEAALKLLFLVLNGAEKEWTMPAREWWMAKAQFAILFGERFTRAMA